MASRTRATLKRKALASNGAGRRRRLDEGAPPLLYTSQDLARICEVDLKTIHHWANAGKVPHRRTSGRHLRFRHNHVVQFLRAHGYPLDALMNARPTVLFAPGARADAESLANKLASRFEVHRFGSGLAAIAHIVAYAADAIVLEKDDASWAGEPALRALKSEPATEWTAIVVLGEGEGAIGGADLVVGDAARLPAELAKHLGLG